MWKTPRAAVQDARFAVFNPRADCAPAAPCSSQSQGRLSGSISLFTVCYPPTVGYPGGHLRSDVGYLPTAGFLGWHTFRRIAGVRC